jgi:hypothetical protein
MIGKIAVYFWHDAPNIGCKEAGWFYNLRGGMLEAQLVP